MIMLTPKTGWAVRVTRADGTHYYATAGFGVAVLVWPKNERKNAAKFARLCVFDNKTRVVRVHYAHPVEIPNRKA